MSHLRPSLFGIIAALLGVLMTTSSVICEEEVGIGSRRELFIDRHLIDELRGVRLKLGEPRHEGTALEFDNPWEGLFCGYITVIKDGELYRMYYRGLPQIGGNQVTCYAESKDAISWTKPNLGLFEIGGTRKNNVILTAEPYTHNFAPFLDTRPGVRIAERFKALGGSRKSGLVAFVSGDGVRFTKLRQEPVITQGAFDSQNVAFWSRSEQCYVCYFRTFKRVGGSGYRWVSRTTSKDFISWTEPVEMQFGNAPLEHLYTSATEPYFRAPHIYIAFPKRFFPGKVALPAKQGEALVENADYRKACADAIFMTSRGGNRYDRTFLEAFIRPGPSPRDWISRSNAPAWGVVPADPRTLFLYRHSHYAQPTAHVTRYSLRTDGFVSVHAPYEGGMLLTKPLRFSGKELEINFATSAGGGIRVGIETADGQSIPGYSITDCPEIIGDQISRIVNWQTGSDVSRLAAQAIRLRFVMKDADLYSLRFVTSQ